MSDEQSYHEQLVAQAEQGLAAAEAKVKKQRGHLAAAEDAVAEAKAPLQAVRDGEHPEYEEPGEHVTVQVEP